MKEGDLLFSKLNPRKQTISEVVSHGTKIVASTEFIVLRAKKNDQRYLKFLLYCSELKSSVCSKIESATKSHQRINPSVISKLKFALPSNEERLQIINFLNHETSKIDTLIQKQQQLIKLLKEKRQAVISHAVTKGLNPDVPMKDSGVEWLGRVPEGWTMKRLKHISPKVGVGLVINPSTYTCDEGVYFIFGGDVKEYDFNLINTRKISSKDSEKLLPSRLSTNDLVCVRVGYPGVTAVVTKELEGANCASVIIIRKGNYNSGWLCAAMNSWVGRQQVELASYGAAQKQFNVSDAVEFLFPFPTKKEQSLIGKYVKNSIKHFKKLIEKTEQQIDLLQERRTALISAAVTGKIDVRDWQPPEQPTPTPNLKENSHELLRR